jgi:hypothetical protein
MDRALRYSTGLYAIGLVAHTADHLRRGTGLLTHHVFWAGNLSTLAGVITVALVFSRHRLAPVMAAAFGVPVAVGVAAVHLLPHWSAFSDAFPGAAPASKVEWISYVVVLVEIIGAALTGIIAVRILGHDRRLQEVGAS